MPSTADLISQITAFLDLGGPVVAILAGVSVISLTVIVLKLYQFMRAGIGSRRRAERAANFFAAGRVREARETASKGLNPATAMIALAIDQVTANRFDKHTTEERITRLATTRLHELQSGFRFLDAVSQLAPLMGLFGTVLGMIEAFKKLETAGNAVDPSILAGGIWVALLTTAVGLAVAMPVSLFLTWLETRVENERIAIETLTSEILTGSPRQANAAHKQANAGEARFAN